jgi:hypothetical protein
MGDAPDLGMINIELTGAPIDEQHPSRRQAERPDAIAAESKWRTTASGRSLFSPCCG